MYDEAAYMDLIYAVGYTGVWAINQTTGQVAWRYSDPAIPFETPYTSDGASTYTVQDIRVIGGLLYVSNNEHTPSQPAQRGWGMICLDGMTGEFQWKLSGTRMQAGAAADGYLTAASNYDGTMYVLARAKARLPFQDHKLQSRKAAASS
jgi:outer membrane protein assembly factor BamB